MNPDEWADAIYEATGWIVSNGLAAAIGGMVGAARRDAAGEVERLRAERDRLRQVVARGLRMREAQAAYFKQRSQEALIAAKTLEVHFERTARAALGEDRA